MKKDKEWLQRQAKQLKIGYECLHDDYYRACDEFIYYINQLEEPNEIELSEPSAWKTIAKLYHPNEVYWGNVRDSYLESLEEPEKVVVNEVMARHIENCKSLKLTLSDSLHLVVPEDKQKEVLFARAWLDGYTVEKEKLYRVELIKGKYLIYNHKNNQLHNQELDAYVGDHEQREFTEQEIKNIDKRYWVFREEAE